MHLIFALQLSVGCFFLAINKTAKLRNVILHQFTGLINDKLNLPQLSSFLFLGSVHILYRK